MIGPSISALLLAGIYLVVLGHASVADAGIALLVGATVTFVYRERLWGSRGQAGPTIQRVIAFFPFLAVSVGEIIAGAIDTSLVVLGLKETSPRIVRVPIGERSRLGVAVTGLVMTLAPGSALIYVDHERGVMVFHVIAGEDPDEVRRRQADFYDRFQRKVFP